MSRKYEEEINNMRELGYSFEKIGKKLGISKQYAHNTYANSKGFTDKQIDLIYKIKYKGIRNWLLDKKMKVKDFCRLCGVCDSMHSSMAKFLIGEQYGNIKTIKKILEVTKMTFEEAFFEDEANK